MDDLGVVAAKGQDLLEMELPPSEMGGPPRMCYVPLVEDIVPVINVQEGYMLLEPPDGLLELAVAKTEKIVIRGFLPGSDEQ
ncbi:hypothetical protein JKP88DRAFT_237610 [Tribonema minus]|uniref:Uncharacterized protein n=1 Tax=Tribonema minus TaxID=303371 RepID=A0A835YZ86_9STRA|nr:hypothetical protein JKP88DRAFT_237610 [Tribonema minus]